jgi:hypothetical protein
VAIVLAPDFATELGALAQQMPVWVLNTPPNRAAVERLRRGSAGLGLTLFSAAAGQSAEEVCAGLLSTVELHHGPYSQDPPCGAIEVIGAVASPLVRAAFSAEGFDVVAVRPGSFIAERVSHTTA